MADLQPVRGTRDLIGDDFRRFAHVINTAREISSRYGFEEWATPIFEDTRVFSRTLGDTSDVVTKEMYSFEDRGGDSITLRPEGTAGVCRALVSNGLTQSLPQKVFYAGPMFRYERPQKGRYRQFHQIDVEVLGSDSPLADAEVIACGWNVIRALGIDDGVVLELNTLGDKDSRDAYRAALVGYFTDHRAGLSEDSINRLDRNPMRILDSKDDKDRRIVADAPTISERAFRFEDRIDGSIAVLDAANNRQVEAVARWERQAAPVQAHVQHDARRAPFCAQLGEQRAAKLPRHCRRQRGGALGRLQHGRRDLVVARHRRHRVRGGGGAGGGSGSSGGGDGGDSDGRGDDVGAWEWCCWQRRKGVRGGQREV